MKINNFQEFVKLAEGGEILIGFDPALARRFFTDTNSSYLNEIIGETLLKERIIVWILFSLEYIFLIAVIITSIFALKLYSIIAIPIILITSFVFGSISSIGKPKVSVAISFLFICILLIFFIDKGKYMTIGLLLLPLPYLSVSAKYMLSTEFLRLCVVRNEKLYNLLVENKQLFIKEAE